MTSLFKAWKRRRLDRRIDAVEQMRASLRRVLSDVEHGHAIPAYEDEAGRHVPVSADEMRLEIQQLTIALGELTRQRRDLEED
jgi:hypothetical protein